MRRISSRRQGERINGRLDADAGASYQPASDAAMRTPPSSPPTSKDFTAQVMARLATPPPPPDPRLARTRERAKRARAIARVYLTMVLIAALGVALLALYAPWVLVTAVTETFNYALDVISGVAYAGRSTGGFVSGTSVLYAMMLAALTPLLFMLWRRVRRQRAR